jgi:putative flippase GtrA
VGEVSEDRDVGQGAVSRLVRFGLVGALCAGVGYIVFRGSLAAGLHYLPANALAWAISLAVGFMLNRTWTFGHRPAARWQRQLGLYLAGSVAQLGISSLGLELLIGRLKLAPAPAWVLNTAACALISFLWLHVVFPARRGPES